MNAAKRHDFHRCGYGGCPRTVHHDGARCVHHRDRARGHAAKVARLRARIAEARAAREGAS